MKRLAITLFSLVFLLSTKAQSDTLIQLDTISPELIREMMRLDSIEQSFHYETKTIELQNGIAVLDVPKGFKYLNAEQSKYVLTELWGNPPTETMGMLFKENESPLDEEMSYAIEISYNDEGYIDDEEAAELDYDDLLTEMQNDILSYNDTRVKQGYERVELVGWASEPFYDANAKKLHWAKELKFGETAEHTLNYDIRILGRKGYLTMNAIADMKNLPVFKQDVDKIIASVEFQDGNKYSDFNPDLDKVAAVGIGGLIAGKLLTKTGILVVLAKFWKFIALGAVGLFAAFKKKLFGEK